MSWRDRVDALVKAHMSDDICFNVWYTAAMYAVDEKAVTLDTWTHDSLNTKTSIQKWMLLTKRIGMMERALDRLGASSEACQAYAAHRRAAFKIAKTT